MAVIVGVHGACAVVDDDVFEWAKNYKWYPLKNRHTTYLVRQDKLRKWILLHREIMDAHSGEEVDHRDLDGLNNLRTNLRKCTSGQNKGNGRKRCRRIGQQPTSKYKGVSYRPERKKWQVQLRMHGKKIHLGFFSNEQDAALAYDAAALQSYGEFARLNF